MPSSQIELNTVNSWPAMRLIFTLHINGSTREFIIVSALDLCIMPLFFSMGNNLKVFWKVQDDKKSKSGRSLNDDSRDEQGDKKKSIFFSWSRNRSFGKGSKKKELGDYGEWGTSVLILYWYWPFFTLIVHLWCSGTIFILFMSAYLFLYFSTP